MNTHLNIFRTYAKENRRYQLENDLTRALAICLQENALFFHEVLKTILDAKHSIELFNDLSSTNDIAISIQKNSTDIGGFEQLFAVSLSEHQMTDEHFWNQSNETNYDPICDIVIKVNEVIIIIETKRDNVDCTSQLYNQAYNVCRKHEKTAEIKGVVTPRDLNWSKLMEIAVKTHSFEKAVGSPSRFLNDFISLIQSHNFRWLPEPSLFSVSPDNKRVIERRIQSALLELQKHSNHKVLEYNDRTGLRFGAPWAQELLFSVMNNGDLCATIYPGNTKAQGVYLFQNDPEVNRNMVIDGKRYPVRMAYHIKFTSFQKYFTSLDFRDDALKEKLYTTKNFWKYCGRKRRGEDWDAIETLFDRSFNKEYNWKEECDWDGSIKNSNKNQFDMSFGYELSIHIPFQDLRNRDQHKSDLSGLTQLIEQVYNGFISIYS